MDRLERLLGLGDAVGQRLVLLADIDVVAHLRQQIRERPAGQERLERRRAIGVVCAAHAVRELCSLLGELEALLVFLRGHLSQLLIHVRELCDEVRVVRLDLVDLGLHPRDLLADRIEVGTDLGELVLRVRDLGRESLLQIVDGGDLRLLLGDPLLERRLLRLRIGEFVGRDGRAGAGRAQEPGHERDQEDERRHVSPDTSSRPGAHRVRPTRGSRCGGLWRELAIRSEQAADHEGDVIVASRLRRSMLS